MVKFTEDTIVQPRETQWFGFYTPGQDRNITLLQDSELYKQVKALCVFWIKFNCFI
jgi:palmitoyl-protein thioesterase